MGVPPRDAASTPISGAPRVRPPISRSVTDAVVMARSTYPQNSCKLLRFFSLLYHARPSSLTGVASYKTCFNSANTLPYITELIDLSTTVRSAMTTPQHRKLLNSNHSWRTSILSSHITPSPLNGTNRLHNYNVLYRQIIILPHRGSSYHILLPPKFLIARSLMTPLYSHNAYMSLTNGGRFKTLHCPHLSPSPNPNPNPNAKCRYSAII